MEKSDSLSPQESLDIIAKVIQQTKENFKEQSFYYLIWGWLLTIAAVAHYLILNFSQFKPDYLPWLIVMPIGWIMCYQYSKKLGIEKPYETHLEKFLKYLWIVIGISIFFFVFVAVTLKIQPAIFILLLAGIGTLVSGLSMKFKPFMIGGGLFFIFSVVSLYIDSSLILLIYAIAIIVGYLVPAYFLKNSWIN